MNQLYLLLKLKDKGSHFFKGKKSVISTGFWQPSLSNPRKEEPAVCTECKLFGWLAAAASFGSLNALWRSVYPWRGARPRNSHNRGQLLSNIGWAQLHKSGNILAELFSRTAKSGRSQLTTGTKQSGKVEPFCVTKYTKYLTFYHFR